MNKQPPAKATPQHFQAHRLDLQQQATQRQQRIHVRTANRQLAGVATDANNMAYSMLVTKTPCPQCGQCSIELLELGDHHVTYCSQCGYRGLSQVSGAT